MAKTYHKLVCRSYTSRPSDPDAKYQLAKFGHTQKAKFRPFWGLKVTQQSWLLLFALSPPSFFAFLASFFFSLAGHLVGFISVGIVFRKAFRILGLGERKGRWVMEQDFHADFQVLVTWFFASFSGVLDWTVLILVWFERSLHSAQVSEESCPWPLKLMMSQRVERTWIRTGGYGRFRGEWVNRGCPFLMSPVASLGLPHINFLIRFSCFFLYIIMAKKMNWAYTHTFKNVSPSPLKVVIYIHAMS